MPTQPSQATAEGMPIDRAQRIKNTAEQLAKSVKAGNVNPDYDFTNHDAIWQCMRLRSGEKLTKEEAYKAYTDALINDLPADKPELPVQRVNRLAKELSAALNDMDDHYLVLVYPSSSREYPVHICLDRDFADLMQKAIKYLEGDK
ncbi:hypothetical protein [Ochrobactrum sp. S1502_03]|uniref:hypothetical protein n=1 Tax=Ochrobactrum sp. S1502_03 TaxID=3108451 RepID=UPI0037CBB929